MTTIEPAKSPGITDVLALSPLQEGLFALWELSQNSAGGVDVYAMQFVVEISQRLDKQLLQRSAELVFNRHDNLRVSLWDKGIKKPVQIVPEEVKLPWREIAVGQDKFDAVAAEELRCPFDLRRGPALRFLLVGLTENRLRLVLTAHHILMDGWSVNLFFAEILQVYAAGGSDADLAPVRPFRSYLGWLGKQKQGNGAELWAAYLNNVEPLMLGDNPQLIGQPPKRTRLNMSGSETEKLIGWGRSHGLTLNSIVQFAWAVVLGRVTDRRDVVFGTTISGRSEGVPGIEEMIGLFINTIPVRVDLDGGTIVSHCLSLQHDSSKMRSVGHLGLAEIQRIAGHSSLFDTLFIFENAPIGAAAEPVSAPDGARFLPLAMESLAHYPLTIAAYLHGGELVIMAESVSDSLSNYNISKIIERIMLVLRQFPEAEYRHPGTLEVLLPDELARLTSGRAVVDYEELAAVEIFTRQVLETPEAIAVQSETKSFNYLELYLAASSLAKILIEQGVGPETFVALALRRSPESIIAILAIFLAGAAYIPIDVDLPDERIENLMNQATPVLVLCDSKHTARFAAEIPKITSIELDYLVSQENCGKFSTVSFPVDSAAYVIFTSGSTGEPKGVIGTQRALVSYCRDHRDNVLAPAQNILNRPLRIAHAWSLSFDASWQPLAGLLAGHCIYLFSEAEMRDAGRLLLGLQNFQIDMIDTSPSLFGQLLAAGLVGDKNSSAHLSVLALGGESISKSLWTQLHNLSGTSVYNCYGPTETTVEAVVSRVTDSEIPVIGRPTSRMSAYVLDSQLRSVPDGVLGELYLSGAQVTRGYLGKSAMTAAHFVANPYAFGQIIYRTGDLVRLADSGSLSFVGRKDAQLKIRGYRVELGEIEAMLHRQPRVAEATVVAVPRAMGIALVGFVSGDELDPILVRQTASKMLPAHMIPTKIIVLSSFPITANGKLDANKLVEIGASTLATANASSEPLSETAKQVGGVLAGVLGFMPGGDDDFFDLGIDSIIAMSIVNELRSQGLELVPQMVFSNPTIRDLASAIDSGETFEFTPREYGNFELLPIVRWMDECGSYRRFTQSVVVQLPKDLSNKQLVQVLQTIIDGHDMLRSQLIDTRDLDLLPTTTQFAEKMLTTFPPGTVAAESIMNYETVSNLFNNLTVAARNANDRINPVLGKMFTATRLQRDDCSDALLLVIHHLAVDAVSWRILLADLVTAGIAVTAGMPPVIAAERTDYRHWCNVVTARAKLPEVLAQKDYWLQVTSGGDPVIGSRRLNPATDTWSSLQSTLAITDSATTSVILSAISKNMSMEDFLLAALTITLTSWRLERKDDATTGAYIALESHGRDDSISENIDTSRTLGWFTSVFPVRLGANDIFDLQRAESDPQSVIELFAQISMQLKALPTGGLDYGVLKYFVKDAELSVADDPQIEFNYLGRFDLGDSVASGSKTMDWLPITDWNINSCLPIDPEPDLPLRYALDVVAVVRAGEHGPELVINWRWSEMLMTEANAEQLAHFWERSVKVIASVLCSD